jgi:probable HAF family extracellular repeat protein
MKNPYALHLAVILGILVAGSAQQSSAQDFSSAGAINNQGEIAGGSLLDDFSAFDAYILDRGPALDLGTFGGFASRADAINDRGDAVGQSDTATVDTNGESISLAFLADKDGVHNLGALAGFKYSQAFGINNHGTVVGWSYNEDPVIPGVTLSGFQATIWDKGSARALGHLGGGSSIAFDINNSGAIVGRSRLANGQNHAFLFVKGVLTDLGTLGGARSEARAINNRGQIAGQALLASGQGHAALWYRGTITDLGTLGGATSRAWAINDRGEIVGESLTADGDLHAFLLSGDQMQDLGTLGGSYSIAFDINNRGEIVGESETATGDVHAFVVRRGVMTDLDAQLPK